MPKTKVTYKSPFEDFAITFDATVKISQNGLEGCLPYYIKADKSKYIGLTKDEVRAKVKEAIKKAILDKCEWIKSIESIDNVRFSKKLLEEVKN